MARENPQEREPEDEVQDEQVNTMIQAAQDEELDARVRRAWEAEEA